VHISLVVAVVQHEHLAILRLLLVMAVQHLLSLVVLVQHGQLLDRLLVAEVQDFLVLVPMVQEPRAVLVVLEAAVLVQETRVELVVQAVFCSTTKEKLWA
jgi:hypothetical protein